MNTAQLIYGILLVQCRNNTG